MVMDVCGLDMSHVINSPGMGKCSQNIRDWHRLLSLFKG
jgi:hypothetical protein